MHQSIAKFKTSSAAYQCHVAIAKLNASRVATFELMPRAIVLSKHNHGTMIMAGGGYLSD